MNIPEEAVDAAVAAIMVSADKPQNLRAMATRVLAAAGHIIAEQSAKAERERIAEAIHVHRFHEKGPDSFYWGMSTAERIACNGEHGGVIHAEAARRIESNQ